MDFLFGETPEVTLPPAVKAQVHQLQYIPFGPERDALIDRLTTTYGLSSDLFDSELGNLGQYLTKSEDTMAGAVDQLQGVSGAMQRFAGADPYMEFYGSPAAREASYLKAMEERNRAAFDPYGSVGSESEMRRGLMSADAARRGISQSGIARRQQDQEQQRYAALKAQADAEALQAARQQGLGEAAAYAQAKGLASQNLGQAADVQGRIAQIATQMPQQRMQAAQLYGNTAMDTGTILGGSQSEQRAAQQEVENYNTNVLNKVAQDYASAQNQRNAAQASLDSSRRTPGFFSDFLMPLASTGLIAAGALGGGGGRSSAQTPSRGSNRQGTVPQQSWDPQIPEYALNLRYQQAAPTSNSWSSYLGRGGSF